MFIIMHVFVPYGIVWYYEYIFMHCRYAFISLLWVHAFVGALVCLSLPLCVCVYGLYDCVHVEVCVHVYKFIFFI